MLNGKILLVLIFFVALVSVATYSSAQTTTIPSWIKNTAGFWANNQISDAEFVSALQYLIDNNILTVSSNAPPVVVPINIPNVDDVEVQVPEEIRERVKNANLEILNFKVSQMLELASHPEIIKALTESNAKFTAMDKRDEYIDTKDSEWIKQPRDQNSPFMNALIENNISKILKTKSVISTTEFGNVYFPEIILTNVYGVNVANTIRTDDYKQSDEQWWDKAKKEYVQIREVQWDNNAKIYSADIVIRIDDSNGRLIGVLKAATPIR